MARRVAMVVAGLPSGVEGFSARPALVHGFRLKQEKGMTHEKSALALAVADGRGPSRFVVWGVLWEGAEVDQVPWSKRSSPLFLRWDCVFR